MHGWLHGLILSTGPLPSAAALQVSFEDLDHNVVDVKLPEGSGAP